MANNVEVIAKIKPKNNGNFALIDAPDVEFEDGVRLDEKLEGMEQEMELLVQTIARFG